MNFDQRHNSTGTGRGTTSAAVFRIMERDIAYYTSTASLEAFSLRKWNAARPPSGLSGVCRAKVALLRGRRRVVF